ncbi:MAG: hypothetical protein ACOYM3_11500 [Terrimicrobiaceae bacterium]
MKTPNIILAVATMISLNTLRAADDISSILNQIQGEGAGKKNTTIEKTTSTPVSTPVPKKKQPTAPAKKQTTQAPAVKQPEVRQIVVWGPTDKLPKDVTGQGVAGNFVIQGEGANGGAELIPATEASNPFARVFVVVNLTSGYPPGTLLPIGQRRLIQVSTNRPLIFIGRGLLPGIYNVQAQ